MVNTCEQIELGVADRCIGMVLQFGVVAINI
jgi:hypothetical protein